MTAEQKIRLTQDLSLTANEPISVEMKDKDLYAYGSELACLRLLNKFRIGLSSDRLKVIFSENLKTWVFIKYSK